MPDRLTAALQSLADRPARLFAVLLLANAVGLPYSGVVHDARLYAAQALDTWDGRFTGDLFFRYGSQAKFTLFPALFAPVCGRFGVEVPFWLGYLAASAAYLAAAQRLLLALLGRTPAAAVAAVLVAATPIPIGGTGLLAVNETFFTPRVPAVALCLLAFERLLAGRPGQAGLLAAAAAALHPLVAAPALAVWGLWVVRSATGWAPGVVAAAAVAVGLLALPVLAVPEFGVRAFGHLDPDWRGWVFRLHKYTDPANWGVGEWMRLAQAGGLAVATAAAWKADRDRRGLVVFAALLAAAGPAVAWLAARSEYALLFQGQAYRWVWPLEFLRLPLGVALVVRLWAAGSERARVLAVLVAGTLGELPPGAFRLYLLAGSIGAVAAVLERGLARVPRRPDWALRATFAAVAAGVILFEINAVAVPLRALGVSRWDQTLDLAERVTVWASIPGPATRLLVVLVVGAVAWRCFRGPWPAVAAALAVHIAVFAGPRTAWAEREFLPAKADAEFIRGYIESRNAPGRPTVYWPCGRIEAPWLWLDCPCYYDTFQLSGNAFHRETAADGHRRSLLVRAFEIDRVRRTDSGFWKQELQPGVPNLFDATWDHPPPGPADLAALAADPAVDVIVLPHEFPGAVASNGRVFIYEAANLRVSE